MRNVEESVPVGSKELSAAWFLGLCVVGFLNQPVI